jgi:hypothetical protein
VTPTQAPLAVRRELEPTHPCIRCGREGVPAENGLCELCNPLELSQPSATQMHGIAAVGIIAFVILMAVVGRAALAGTGPFAGQVGAVAVAPDGLADDHSRERGWATATTLRHQETPSRPPTQVVQTPLVEAGASVEFTTVVTKFGSTPVALAADCTAP